MDRLFSRLGFMISQLTHSCCGQYYCDDCTVLVIFSTCNSPSYSLSQHGRDFFLIFCNYPGDERVAIQLAGYMTNTKSWPHQKESQHKLIHASYVMWFWKLASLQELFAGLVDNDLSWRTNPNTHWERIHVQGSLFLSSIFCQHTLTPLLGSGEITHLRGGEYRTLLKQTCSTEEHLLCFLYASYKPGEHRNDSPGTRYKSLTITLRFIYSTEVYCLFSAGILFLGLYIFPFSSY